MKRQWFLPIHANLSTFNQNMANVKMQDAYYLETSLKGTGSVIIIANDQLMSTTAYLLSFLLEIVSVAFDEHLFRFSSVVPTFHCTCLS